MCNLDKIQFSWFWNKLENTPRKVSVSLPQLFFILKNPVDSGARIAEAATAVNQYRKTGNVVYKNSLPVFTPCVEVISKASSIENKIISYSGLTQIDIDPKDNPELLKSCEDAEILRDKLSKLPFVALAAISASGTGVWLLVGVHEPHSMLVRYYQEYYNYFENLGIKLDKSKGSNPMSLRYYAPDVNAVLNDSWQPIELTPGQLQPHPVKPPKPAKLQASTGYVSSIDDFNRRGDVVGLLLCNGWAIDSQHGNKTLLRRPGRTEGKQAEFDESKNMLYVFSDSASPFSNDWYTRASVWGVLNGIRVSDGKALAAALRAAGFGNYIKKQ